MPHSVASDLCLHCLPISHKKRTLGLYGLEILKLISINEQLQMSYLLNSLECYVNGVPEVYGREQF